MMTNEEIRIRCLEFVIEDLPEGASVPWDAVIRAAAAYEAYVVSGRVPSRDEVETALQ